MTETHDSSGPATFDTVRAREIELIARERGVDPRIAEGELVGLALSGGGIRSATFSLGVLQACARLGLLRRLDYLSTVSGGGYAGAFLSALIHRQGAGRAQNIEQSLAGWDARTDAEHHGIRFLRAHSNYLTPRVGWLSADTMTAITIYVRNLVLNLLLLIACLTCALLGVRVVGWVSNPAAQAGGDALVALTAGLLAVGIWVCAINLARDARTARDSLVCQWWFVALTVVASAGLAAWALSHYIWLSTAYGPPGWGWVGAIAAGYAGCWAIGIAIAGLTTPRAQSGAPRQATSAAPVPTRRLRWWAAAAFFALAAGAIGGLAFKLIAEGYFLARASLPPSLSKALWWMVPVFGAAVIFVAFMLVVTVHIGLVGRQFSEEQREWWGRVGAYCNAWVLGWTALFAFAYLAAPVVEAATAAAASAGLASVVTTIAGVLAGRSARTGGDEPRRRGWLDVLARIAPWVFAVAILCVLGFLVDRLLGATLAGGACEQADDGSLLGRIASRNACTAPDTVLATLAGALAVALAIAALLSWRVNVNLFSYHHFYRYRLTRCYLGATHPPERGRHPHPLTGIDPDDDLPLAQLAQRPYPIINTALNLAAGRQLAWQTRKAASFILTPLYCGYHRVSTREQAGHYRPTARYGAQDHPDGLQLGAAIATSGAAASPAMGFHTSTAVAFLLTVFNVRLGRWSPNPARPRWNAEADPGFALGYLLAELAGTADMERDYVYLSDGGHFENTGLYELARRRLRTIIVADCGADPACRFDDIANAIRRVRVDLGADVDLDLAPLRPDAQTGHSPAHHAAGTIRYRDGSIGTLIVLRPSLAAGVPADVLGYAAAHRGFPQQSTADQWFDEDQFESYRRLGEHVAFTALGEVWGALGVASDPAGKS